METPFEPSGLLQYGKGAVRNSGAGRRWGEFTMSKSVGKKNIGFIAYDGKDNFAIHLFFYLYI